MGLDTTHDCWHGAYSAFMRWRQAVAKAAGIPLMLMEGFHTCPPDYDERVQQAKIWRKSLAETGNMAGRFDPLACWALDVDDLLPLSWERFRADPICVLLNHSDCGGEIAAADCGLLADRLAEILPAMPKGDGGGHIGDWEAKTQAFIDGLRRAAAAGENVEFH